jgi:hypothetical protein
MAQYPINSQIAIRFGGPIKNQSGHRVVSFSAPG